MRLHAWAAGLAAAACATPPSPVPARVGVMEDIPALDRSAASEHFVLRTAVRESWVSDQALEVLESTLAAAPEVAPFAAHEKVHDGLVGEVLLHRFPPATGPGRAPSTDPHAARSTLAFPRPVPAHLNPHPVLPPDLAASLAHEAFHLWMAGRTDDHGPLWWREGLAETAAEQVMAARLGRSAGVARNYAEESVMELRAAADGPQWRTPSDLFAGRIGASRQLFYAASWWAVATLRELDPEAFARMGEVLQAGGDPATTLRDHYDLDVGGLDALMRGRLARVEPSVWRRGREIQSVGERSWLLAPWPGGTVRLFTAGPGGPVRQVSGQVLFAGGGGAELWIYAGWGGSTLGATAEGGMRLGLHSAGRLTVGRVVDGRVVVEPAIRTARPWPGRPVPFLVALVDGHLEVSFGDEHHSLPAPLLGTGRWGIGLWDGVCRVEDLAFGRRQVADLEGFAPHEAEQVQGDG